MESITKQTISTKRQESFLEFQIFLPSAISINSQWELSKDAVNPMYENDMLCS